MKKRILSGIRPTGDLHIGHYLGVISNWVELQEEFDCYYMIADLHAITSSYDKEKFQDKILETLAVYMACGLDPEKVTLFKQSDISEHTDLAWLFNCITPMGELSRMTQFKEKSETQAENVNAGLWDYPVLMTADILIYNADLVPVGEDQLQHVEFSRTLARKFNNQFAKVFNEPKALLTKEPRVKSLLYPNKKMSKTDAAGNYIAILDPPEIIEKKIGSAVTDTGPSGTKTPGVENLFRLLEAFSPKEIYNNMDNQYEIGDLKYSELKKVLSDSITKKLVPIQQKYQELISNPENLYQILESGNSQARKVASENLKNAKKAMGLI